MQAFRRRVSPHAPDELERGAKELAGRFVLSLSHGPKDPVEDACYTATPKARLTDLDGGTLVVAIDATALIPVGSRARPIWTDIDERRRSRLRIPAPEPKIPQPGTRSGTLRIAETNAEVDRSLIASVGHNVMELRRVAAIALGYLSADDVKAARAVLAAFLCSTR